MIREIFFRVNEKNARFDELRKIYFSFLHLRFQLLFRKWRQINFILFYYFFVLLVPLDNDVKVRKIEVVDFVPEEGNTTFSVKFSWIAPAFNVSVYGYFFKYELTGYTKHEIIIDGNVVWNF